MFATLEAKVIAIGVLVVAILLGLAYVKQTGVEEQKAADSVQHAKDLDAVQAESTRRIKAQSEVAHDAQLQADAARADAAGARDERDAFRVRLAAFLAKARDPHSAAAAAGAPDGDPIGVLAQVLGEADRFAEDVAAEADSNRIAGLACERSYDALTPQP